LKLRVDEVRRGEHRGVREVVEHRGSAAVLPILPDGRVVLIRQYRYSVGRELLEVPAGTLEEGESPRECAVRELEEETGYRAGRIREILKIFPTPGYSTEEIHLFVAEDLERGEQSVEEDESISVTVMNLEEAVENLVNSGEADAKTLLFLLLYKYLKD